MPNSYWNGSDGSGGFTSRGARFNNSYDSTYGDWSGWAYSNVNNTTDGTWNNQYAAYAGTGGSGSGNYGVAYVGDPTFGGEVPTVTIPAGEKVQSAMITNTTYTALTMLNGDPYGFSTPFGPDDWFLLSITGENAADNPIRSVDFYLARNGSIVDTWEPVDLSSLSAAKSLRFTLTSSDTGAYGMNTPAYFAMDDLTFEPTPEPSTLALLSAGGVCGAVWGYRRRCARQAAGRVGKDRDRKATRPA